MTPIKHSRHPPGERVLDHYFGTYPNATNGSGQTFNAKPNTRGERAEREPVDTGDYFAQGLLLA